MDIAELENRTLTELQDLARSMSITGYTRLKKYDLIMRILRSNTEQQGLIFGGGTLEVVQDGIGFLRADKHMMPGPEDVYVSQSQIRRFGLRTGDFVVGQVRPPKESEKYFGLLKVEAVNGLDPEEAKQPAKVRRSDPHLPIPAVESRDAAIDSGYASDRSRGAHRARAARPDRVAAQSRQDDRAQADRQRHHHATSRDVHLMVVPDRRAP